MKFLTLIFVTLILLHSSPVQGQGLLSLLFGSWGGGGGGGRCGGLQRCWIRDLRQILLSRQLSPGFPHHLQRRGPNTRYTYIGDNLGGVEFTVNAYLSIPGAFLAYDSKYDPQYSPCNDCVGGDHFSDNCIYKSCYKARTILIGRNYF